MVNLKIDGIEISVPEKTTILNAAKEAGIEVPSLCYLKDLNEIGACRICCVEIKGENKLVPSCNNAVSEGMEVYTNSPRVKLARRKNLELILSQHDTNCAVCVRNGTCKLQALAKEQNIYDAYFEKDLPSHKSRMWNEHFPLVRDAGKCIKCMRCVQVCDKVQSLNIWDLAGTGSRTRVDVAGNKLIQQADCSLCGQCVTHCPVGALYAREDTWKVEQAIADPNKIVVAQIAPAVRAAWAENLGLSQEEATVNHLAAALKKIGFDYVFDTSYSADLTIMEEGTELISRLTKGELEEFPMFTSCCPGWVRFLKSQYPELTGQLSTAKSPQQMFGAITKSYFASSIGADPENIVCVSIMPCMAKKAECDLPTMEAGGIKDVDYSLTTRSVARMISADRIDVSALEPVEFDHLLKDYSGAGVIFGATGGVMEAALRSAHYLVTGENPDADAFHDVRAFQDDERVWREATFNVGQVPLRVAITSGLGNARALIEAIKAGKVKYDFVEIMACPGGCAGGGGQTIHLDDDERAHSRASILYNLDENAALRFSHENPDVIRLYEDFLEEPNSHLAHKLLHTDHFGWDMPGQSKK